MGANLTPIGLICLSLHLQRESSVESGRERAVMDGAGGSGADDVEVQGESIDERWEPAYRRELRREYREFIDETKSEWA